MVCRGTIMKLGFLGEERATLVDHFFTDFLDSFGRVDLPISGNEFTWSRGNANPSFSKIDRLLISTAWEEAFLHSTEFVLPIPISDHYPILLDCESARTQTFRFEIM